MLRLRLSAAFLVCFALVQVGTRSRRRTQARPARRARRPDAPRRRRRQPGQPAAGHRRSAGRRPQQPVFRGGINFVRVDVIVTDKKAQPVTNLTQADFEVLEDGKPQRSSSSS